LIIGALEMERVTGIEPAYFAWEANVLPLNYTRPAVMLHTGVFAVVRQTRYRKHRPNRYNIQPEDFRHQEGASELQRHRFYLN
jgi:hypothetical protein